VKSPVLFMTLMPSPPIFWCAWSLAATGGIDRTLVLITLGLIAFGWGGAWYLVRSTQKLVDRRVYVDVRPNHVTVSDGHQFDGKFSTSACLIADLEALGGVLKDVADRAFAGTNKLFSMKESVHIRVWPGSLRLSFAEVEALRELADALFIEPEIEIVRSAGDDRTAMQA